MEGDGVAERAGLEIFQCESSNSARNFGTRVNTGESGTSGSTVLYRRLPSITAGYRILFPPNIPRHHAEVRRTRSVGPVEPRYVAGIEN
jgi:hypothetical protein